MGVLSKVCLFFFKMFLPSVLRPCVLEAYTPWIHRSEDLACLKGWKGGSTKPAK